MPTCAHYTHYLLALAHNAPYEMAVAALLPCFWIYWEVGKHLLETARPDNPIRPGSTPMPTRRSPRACAR